MIDASQHYDWLGEVAATHEIRHNGFWHRGELGKSFHDGTREFRVARFDCNYCGRVSTTVPADDPAWSREVAP